MVELIIQKKLPWMATMALVGSLAMPLTGHSAELNLEFSEPERYSDIEPARENRSRFHERTLEGLEQIFNELAQTLPDDQTFNVTVLDVNLAGYVEQARRGGGMEPVRVVRQGHAPSLKLQYSLVDSVGNTLQEGEETIRGRGIEGQLRHGNRGKQDMLSLERDMITRWFEDNFDAS